LRYEIEAKHKNDEQAYRTKAKHTPVKTPTAGEFDRAGARKALGIKAFAARDGLTLLVFLLGLLQRLVEHAHRLAPPAPPLVIRDNFAKAPPEIAHDLDGRQRARIKLNLYASTGRGK
jgi:hypothetical protein